MEDDANADSDNTPGTEDMAPTTEADATVEVDSALEEVDTMIDGEMRRRRRLWELLSDAAMVYALTDALEAPVFKGGVCMDGACFPPNVKPMINVVRTKSAGKESCIPKVNCETAADCDENQACARNICDLYPDAWVTETAIKMRSANGAFVASV